MTGGTETGTDTEGEEEREDESRASGSSGAEWSGASADEWTLKLTRYNILHRPESSDWVTAVLGLKNHPIMSTLSGHGDRTKRQDV